MNRRAQTIIGLTVVVLGLGLFALGFLEQESSVRQVYDVVAAPEDHTTGTYTLVGMPQPAVLAGQEGSPANPDYDNTTLRSHRWQQGETIYLTTFMQSYERIDAETVRWTLLNATRVTSSSAPPVLAWTNWTMAWSGEILQVDDFETGDTVWAVFDGNLREPMRPTPSQLTGRTVAAPEGFVIYEIEPDGYTMGCSSKFVPEDRRAEFDADGDGRTD